LARPGPRLAEISLAGDTSWFFPFQCDPVQFDVCGRGFDGALVDQAQPGTPAALAGLEPGDVITKPNGEPVKDAGDLTRRVGSLKPGDKVELAFIRNGVEKTVNMADGTDHILGATVVARHAGEMINGLSLAITTGTGLRALAKVIHTYPTQAEAIKMAAEAYCRTRLTPQRKSLAKRWLARR
jgi:membrane-associated protease RseP (regulator of RpoE activity)